MNAHDARASQNADCDGRRRPREALAPIVARAFEKRLVQRPFDEGFARGSEQDGQAEFGDDAIKIVDQSQVLFGTLAEPDAGIEDDLRMPRAATERLFD